ncbi:aminoglycoside phosphotransferase [Krasilnikovia sp. M28-CT-15]|uniref:aminoglycoside phosphotransferase n=1 Tax=Krasilnikovia sp. M28-CT-15 TaxID=3373540 RepID=UPI0038778C9D
MRSDWTASPKAVTTEIAERLGGAFEVTPAVTGDHAEIASAVTGPDGTVFIKAASAETNVLTLRYEPAVTKAVGRYPAAVLWDFQSDGWLVVGTEYLDGPHADLSPGSPDLDLLAATLNELQETPAPGQPWFSPEARLGFGHPAMKGGTVIHSDLNPANLIVTTDGLRLVDWAWANKAASWVELALVVQWLIGSGHDPEQAEDWLARFPAWAATDPQILDEFAARNASKWSVKSRRSTHGWVHDLAAATGTWAAYRRVRSLRP